MICVADLIACRLNFSLSDVVCRPVTPRLWVVSLCGFRKFCLSLLAGWCEGFCGVRVGLAAPVVLVPFLLEREIEAKDDFIPHHLFSSSIQAWYVDLPWSLHLPNVCLNGVCLKGVGICPIVTCQCGSWCFAKKISPMRTFVVYEFLLQHNSNSFPLCRSLRNIVDWRPPVTGRSCRIVWLKVPPFKS